MSYAGNQLYMPVDTVDDTAQATDMMGPGSLANQAKGKVFGTTTNSLILLWVAALLLYWILGYFFRGQRS